MSKIKKTVRDDRRTTGLIELATTLKPVDFNSRTFHVTFACRNSKILAIDVNKPHHTQPYNLHLDYVDDEEKNISNLVWTHSELHCWIKLGTPMDCSKLDFYVIRIDNNNTPAMSKPCRGCRSLFSQIRYRRVYYTINKKGDFELL